MCLAIPMKVLEVQNLEHDRATGMVEVGGLRREVDLSLVRGVKPGEYVIVHAGFAISVSNEEEAQKTLALFEEIRAAALTGTKTDP